MIWTKVFIVIALQLAGLSLMGIIRQGFGKLDDWSESDREVVGCWVWFVDLLVCVGLFLYWMGW